MLDVWLILFVAQIELIMMHAARLSREEYDLDNCARSCTGDAGVALTMALSPITLTAIRSRMKEAICVLNAVVEPQRDDVHRTSGSGLASFLQDLR